MTDRDLRMVYRDIPSAGMRCKSGCSDCCGPVPWSDAEIARVAVPLHAEWIDLFGVRALQDPLTGKCPFVTPAGCAVYDRRPFMCRLFGSTPSEPRLACPHGCRPSRTLTAPQAAALTCRYRGA